MKKIGKNTAIVACVGILGITTIACVAVSNGVDGTVMSSCIGAVGLIVGGVLGFRVGRKEA